MKWSNEAKAAVAAHASAPAWVAARRAEEGPGEKDRSDVALERLAHALKVWGRHTAAFAQLACELAAHTRRREAGEEGGVGNGARAGGVKDRVGALGAGGGWTKEDRALLRKTLQKYPKGSERRWENIAAAFGGRRSEDDVKRMVAELVLAARAASQAKIEVT